MSLTERLAEYIRACFAGIWIVSHEHEDAVADLSQLCHRESWSLATWDIDQGLRLGSQTQAATSQPDAPGNAALEGANDPIVAIRALSAAAVPNSVAILVLKNMHRFLQSAEICEAIARQITLGKQNRTFLVVLSPIVTIPVELERLFVVIDHELPGREQLAEIARGIATLPGELPDDAHVHSILDAAVGLTRYEAEEAFSLALVRQGRLTAETLWEQKAQMLRKGGLLSLYRGGADFASLGGMSALKSFCQQALRPKHRDRPNVRPRGVLLLSPSGCGKSQLSKALGNEVGRPVVMLDIGALMGSLVGQTECAV